MIIVALISIFLYQQNSPPVVKITLPKTGATVPVNSTIRYSISVSDKEDGDTKYDEIVLNEILLRVSSGADTSKKDRMILHSMMASNCMNCHAFTSKLIGPSFSEISTRYSSSADTAEIIKRVREGSKGIWGDIVMPTHHELSEQETSKMVQWILKFNKKKNVQYYLGSEGSFRVEKPVLLTASYLDHHKAIGEDRMLINVK